VVNYQRRITAPRARHLKCQFHRAKMQFSVSAKIYFPSMRTKKAKPTFPVLGIKMRENNITPFKLMHPVTATYRHVVGVFGGDCGGW